MKIKVSDYIAEFLAENSINKIFTVTGGGAMHLNDSFGHNNKLDCIYNHHEQASAIGAEGYTRYSGKLAGVCVTSGPGGTNALTGVVGGWLDSIPMFIISGQVKRETTICNAKLPLRQLGDQEYNIIDSVRPMTKYAVMITDPNKIAYHLNKALYMAMNGRKGPVWLDIPIDVQGAIIDTKDLIEFNKADSEKKEEPPKVTDATISEFVKYIEEAKRPVIIAGTGIRLGGAEKEFIKFIEKLGVPVVTAWNAHDILWNEHPLFCGRPGTLGTRGGNFIVENSDLIISLGCRLSIRQISYNYKDFAKKAKKIVVDIDEAELKKPTINPSLPIHADVKDFCTKVINSEYKPSDYKYNDWLKWCREIDERYPVCLKEYYKKSTPINPYVFIEKLFDEMDEEEAIVCGNGTACVVTFQGAKIKEKQRLFTNSGCASMGYGFPAAIGVSLYRGKKRTICIDGDGSFQMNIQELQTVMQNKFNIKTFILNNDGYHSIRQTQSNLFGEKPLVGVSKENGISFPELKKIAYAYDIPYIRINSIEEISEKVKETLCSDGPVLCEVILDKDQFFEPKLSSKVLDDGSIVSPAIDDMFPFLDRSEYEKNKLC